jgi:predicted  nucleic acid-binding Zn-ribbon protein
MNRSGIRLILIVTMALTGIVRLVGQTGIPEIFDKGSLSDQMNYLEERTRIYENYRAIREDMFQQIKRNALDSLVAAKTEITVLTVLKTKLIHNVDSLNTQLETTKNKLDEAISTKNSIKVLGIEVNKIGYNTFMWILIAGLAFLLVTGFLAFKRNLTVTKNTKKDLDDLKAEFEAYRKSSREAREKMSMDHFNELKKLKGR